MSRWRYEVFDGDATVDGSAWQCADRVDSPYVDDLDSAEAVAARVLQWALSESRAGDEVLVRVWDTKDSVLATATGVAQ